MIIKSEKKPKVALCRKCHGSGMVQYTKDGVTYVDQCPQCKGSGRVVVSAKLEYNIQPYIID